MYKIHDRAWINSGYYKGQFGVIVGWYSNLFDTWYTLEIYVIGGRPCERKVIVECEENELELL